MHLCVFLCLFVKCTLLWVPFWYPPPRPRFFSEFFDEYNWFACEKTYFPTKINQKCVLNEISASFLWAPQQKCLFSFFKHDGLKRFPSLETSSIVLVMLSVWDLRLILMGGERGVSTVLSGELQWHGLMLCHWQEQHRRPKRRLFSSRQPRHFVCHFGSSFGDSWTSASDKRTSEAVRL